MPVPWLNATPEGWRFKPRTYTRRRTQDTAPSPQQSRIAYEAAQACGSPMFRPPCGDHMDGNGLTSGTSGPRAFLVVERAPICASPQRKQTQEVSDESERRSKRVWR